MIGIQVLYTGDFNTTADRQLGAAVVPRLEPSLLITECTYGGHVRGWRRRKERELLTLVRRVVESGGKVLIPSFAVGRAQVKHEEDFLTSLLIILNHSEEPRTVTMLQEVCALLDEYWTANGPALTTRVPIFMASEMAEMSAHHYRTFQDWTITPVADVEITGRPVDRCATTEFRHIQPFRHRDHWPLVLQRGRPMVLFAAPGMLTGGLALQTFKQWCARPSSLSHNLQQKQFPCLRAMQGQLCRKFDTVDWLLRLGHCWPCFTARAAPKGQCWEYAALLSYDFQAVKV